MTIQRFHQLNNTSMTEVSDKAKRMLCDKDPSVMGAALHLLLDLIEDDINEYKDLTSSFVSILKQIIEHRLPKDYDYHRMPAPWIQIKLLQILALLGTANKSASEGMYEVLHEVMRRADIGINVGYAIIYECVRTVTTIYPNAQLLAEAAKCTSRFITSENHNLKYLGINALASIVQVNPGAANEHQMVVIDCLEDRDETLRRKTLDLLFRMTNENNVNVICTKLIASLKDSVDVFLRRELVEKITSLAEKYAPDTIWFIETMSDVFELGAELVKPQFAHNFVKTLAEGIAENEEDDESDEDIKQYAADFFYEVLNTKTRIPNILMKIVCWVLGEYGQVCTGQSVLMEGNDEYKNDDDIEFIGALSVILRLWMTIEKQESYDLSIRQWAMSATFKLIKHLDPIPDEIGNIIKKYQTSTHSDLVQLSHELCALSEERDIMNKVFIHSSVVHDINVDRDLKFLDAFVNRRLEESNGELSRYSLPETSEYLYADDNIMNKPSLKIFNEPDASEMESILNPSMIQSSSDNNTYDKVDMFSAHAMHSSAIDLREDERMMYHKPVVQESSSLKKIQGSWGHSSSNVVLNEKNNEIQNKMSGNEVIAEHTSMYNTSITTLSNPYSIGNISKEVGSIEVSPKYKVKPKLKPEILSERQIQANILFGDAPPVRRRSRVTRKKKKKQISKQSNVIIADDNIFEMLDVGQVEQQVDTPVSIPVQVDNILDIMGGDIIDDDDGGSYVDDIFSALTSDPPPPSSSVVVNDITTDDMNDLFGGFMNNDNNNNEIVSGNKQIKGYSALQSILSAEISSYAKSHESDQILHSSDIEISFFKVYKKQQSTLCLFLSNNVNDVLSSIQIKVNIDNQSSLQLGFDVGHSIPSPQLINARTAVLKTLNVNETACQMITFGAMNPNQIHIPCKFVFNINYKRNGNSNNIQLNIPFNISDVLRPSVISTADFGGNWQKLEQNAQQVIVNNSSCHTCKEYVDRIKKRLNVYHIQTIGNEMISAGSIASLQNRAMFVPCLIHCKLNGKGMYTVQIRTCSMFVSKAIAVQIQDILQ